MQSGGHLLEQVPALMSRPTHCCHTGTVFSCMLCIYRYICCFILICFFILLLCCQNIFDLIWLKCWRVQKKLRLPIVSSELDVKAQWTKCMTSWCAYLPLTGKQEIAVKYTPLERTSTKEVVFKVQCRPSRFLLSLFQLSTEPRCTTVTCELVEYWEISHFSDKIERH